MTGPKDPGDDWGFPEVGPASTTPDAGPASTTPDAGPASTELPEPDEPVYDTGSDAWWRAQAEAQRQAAAAEPVVPPDPPTPPAPPPLPELVEPTVLNAPSPLDQTWIPPELPELRPAEPEPEPEPSVVEDLAPVPAPEPGTERVGPARALAGAALALLGVLLAIGALLVFNGNSEPKGSPVVASSPLPSATPTPSASASSSPTASAPPVPVVVPSKTAAAQPPIVAVRVLNNSRIQHLAERAAQRFRAGGWPVPQTGNYRGGNLSTTTVYYPPGQQASAERFAKQFGIPRVSPRFAGIPVPGMTVIVTRDYQP
ncbi:MAG: glycoprotein [Frankiales bacterium]|nr:glycoprotein [Frankiales bacterium]